MPLNDFRPGQSGGTLELDSLHLAALPQSVRMARRLVSDRLPQWDLDYLLDPVMLVVSEYATNAVRFSSQQTPGECTVVHGETPVMYGVQLRRTATHLFAEVTDISPHPPAPRTAGELDEGGRGLALVEDQADHVGWHPTGTGGKVVWAAWELALASRASHGDILGSRSPAESGVDPVVLAGHTTTHASGREARQ